MLVKLFTSTVLLILGLVIGITIGQYQVTPALAINVVGGEIITRSETDVDFRVFKTDVETVEVKIERNPKKDPDPERDTGEFISTEAEAELQFLLNTHQSLSSLQTQFPCPGVDCDPDIETDPALCSIFWEDLDPSIDHPTLPSNTFDTLTSRNVIIGIEWDGTIYNLTLRNPSTNPANFPNNC